MRCIHLRTHSHTLTLTLIHVKIYTTMKLKSYTRTHATATHAYIRGMCTKHSLICLLFYRIYLFAFLVPSENKSDVAEGIREVLYGALPSLRERLTHVLMVSHFVKFELVFVCFCTVCIVVACACACACARACVRVRVRVRACVCVCACVRACFVRLHLHILTVVN